MASPKKRLRRRERRRARKPKPEVKKFMTYCKEDGLSVKHWVCVNEKGQIHLRSHPDIPLQAMKAEAAMGNLCGCFWAVARLFLSEHAVEEIMHGRARTVREVDDRALSEGFIKFLHDARNKRQHRENTKRIDVACTMRPLLVLHLH